ncbi:uncharacterized protein [Chelonus insularis]|uniref:uncharacterized protein n=1 Tax=Chelonus insularis TaxID=460826 RepID=UPI00158CA1A2|nr:uncharacterized protein LOC118067389 [Chelonus insularis]
MDNENSHSLTHPDLPDKSKKLYTSAYENFIKWRSKKGTSLASESVLLEYFTELNEKYKPSSLWAIYSMLKKTLSMQEKININNYNKLSSLLKKLSRGFKSTKSRVLSSENIEKFINEAPDEVYLVTKVALIFGIMGACRSQELKNCTIDDITKQGDIFLVNIPKTSTEKSRTFIITEDYAEIVQKYLDLRNVNAPTNRFFLKFTNGKCTIQVVGRNKFAKMPQEIAKFLKLENPETFTGHCFRRTGATVVADAGASIIDLKRFGGWKSRSVVKGYIKESIQNKQKLDDTIADAINSTNSNNSIDIDESPAMIIKDSYSEEENTNSNPCSTDNLNENKNTIIIDKTSSNTNSNLSSYLNNTDVLSLNGGLKFENCSVTINYYNKN